MRSEPPPLASATDTGPFAAPPPPPRSRAGVRVTAVVALAASLGTCGLLGVRVKAATAKRAEVATARASAQTEANKKPPTRTTHPIPSRWRPRVEVTGTLRPWRDADVGFPLGGRITRVDVAVGQTVKAGTTLAVLDARSAGAQVSQAAAGRRAAEANLALAQDNLHRTEALVAAKSVPESQAEQAREQVALMRAQLDGARAGEQLARTGQGDHAIVAPFDGVVTRAPTAAGGVVQPDTPLVHVEDLSRFRLSATLGEEDALLVKLGAPVTVVVRDRSVTGKVVAVVPSLDPATRRAPVEVAVPNDQASPLLGWSFVHATIESPGADVGVLRVPADARRPGSQSELVVSNGGRAHLVRVVKAIDADGSWLVREGLTANDSVVLAPDADTQEGDLLP